MPRVLELRRRFIPGAPRFPGGEVERFLAFALDTGAGRRIATVLQYRIGTENGGYRGYRLQSAGDANGDGRGDLVFHVGGNLPEEAVVLLDRGDRFEARPSGPLRCGCRLSETLALVTTDIEEARELGGWDVSRARFVGREVGWVLGAEAPLRDGVGREATTLAVAAGGSVIRLLPVENAPPGWLAAAVDDARGWISARQIASQSPLEID